jgi:hypothetical protein
MKGVKSTLLRKSREINLHPKFKEPPQRYFS